MAKFKIPEGYNAWCMLCHKGFHFFDDLAKHNRENVEEHKRRSGKKKPEEKKIILEKEATNGEQRIAIQSN